MKQSKSLFESIGAVLMVKDEEKNIRKSLESIQKAGIKWIGIYDTGSTDSTLDICRTTTKCKLDICESTWENFGTTRTKALKWGENTAPTGIEWLLMLDANDEIKMLSPTPSQVTTPIVGADAYKIKQYLYRTRDLRAHWRNFLFKRGIGWECIGHVYENYRLPHKIEPNFGIIDWFTVYQNRDDDDQKSKKRAESWDLKCFEEHTVSALGESLTSGQASSTLRSDPKDPEEISKKYRTIYYHAQTHLIVGQVDKAYNLYEARTKWVGNTAHCQGSMYTCGSIAEDREDWKCALNWFHSALELGERWTKKLCVASLLGLGRIYTKLKMYNLAYTHLLASLDEKEPDGIADFVTWSPWDYGWRRSLLFGRAASFFLHDPVKRKKGVTELCKALLDPHLPKLYHTEIHSLLNKKFYGKIFHICSPYNGGSNLMKKILNANGYPTSIFNQKLWKHTTRWDKLEQKIKDSQENERWIICYRDPASWGNSMKKHSYNLKFDDPRKEIHFTGEPIQNEPERKFPSLGDCYYERYTRYIELTQKFPTKIRWVSYEQVILRGVPYINKKLNIRLDAGVTDEVFKKPAKDHGKSVQNVTEARNKLIGGKKIGWNMYTSEMKAKLEELHEICSLYTSS